MSRAHLALLLTTIIYGIFYVGIKILVVEIPPWDVFLLRLLLATPLFFILEKLFFNTRIASKKDLLKITGLGLIGVTIVQLTIVMGLKHTSVFHTGFLVGTAPMITLILSVLLRQERLSWEKCLGIGIAFAGLMLLLSARGGKAHLPPDYLLGDAIVLLNIIGWSLYLILSRPLLAKYPPFSLSAYAFICSGIITLPWMVFLSGSVPGVGLSLHGWLWMAYVVVLSTIVTYFLNYYGLSRLSASTVSVYVFLQPIVTAITAHWLLGEEITLLMLLEGLMIIVGVAIATGTHRALFVRAKM